MKRSIRKLYRPMLLLLMLLIGFLWLRPPYSLLQQTPANSRRDLTPEELCSVVSQMRLEHPKITAHPRDQHLIALGFKFFFDPGFSANGQISCATCHQPDKSFTDGLPTSQGIGHSGMNAPTLINTYAGEWFFWNGRADSLEAQALGPVENPKEHGFSRAKVMRRIAQFYRADYEQIFGPLPKTPAPAPAEDMPAPMPPRPLVSQEIAAFALATLGSSKFQKMILMQALSNREQPVDTLRRLAAGSSQSVSSAKSPITTLASATASASASASPSNAASAATELNQINHVFANFARAIAAFERTIRTDLSPFDLFADRLAQNPNSESSLGDGFGPAELRGLKLFSGRGQCITCHAGPRLTDEQFHNIGLAATSDEAIDLGRAQGLLMARHDPFNCQGSYLNHPKAAPREACLELVHLESESVNAVGAFKTPTLRNLKFTAPYGHDGRFPRLRDILQHYNHLGVPPAVGHSEETLVPLNFSDEELQDMEAFLMSLNSQVHFYRGEP
jgi:cytochrome c peroxidase